MAFLPHERFWPGDPYLLKELVRKENDISARHVAISQKKGNKRDEIVPTRQHSKLQQNYQKRRNPFSEDHVFGIISKPLSKEGKRSITVEDIISGKFAAVTETDHRRRAQRRLEDIKTCRDPSFNELFSGSKDDDMFKSPRMTNNERSIKLLLPEDTLASNNNLSIRAGINSRSVHTGSTMRSRRLESPRKQFSPNTKLNFSPKKIISTFR